MKEEKVEFRVGKESLRGTVFAPSGKGLFPGVVFYHGRGSSRKRYLPIAKKLAEKGILALAFDFRGCGESGGVFENQTHQNGVEDAATAVEFILQQNIDQKRLGLCGSSFGSYVAGMILPKYPLIKSLLLRSPAAYSDKLLLATGYQEVDFFADKKNWEESSAYENIENFRGTVLILKCENDELLPEELVDEYYSRAINAQKRQIKTLKGADHSLSNLDSLEKFYGLTLNWFLKTL